MNKIEHFKDRPGLKDPGTLDFIARNIIYPERPRSGEKAVNLENMMVRLGGTKGEIDLLSRIKMTKKRMKNR